MRYTYDDSDAAILTRSASEGSGGSSSLTLRVNIGPLAVTRV